jgi:Conserved hypothetical ATP binding protein
LISVDDVATELAMGPNGVLVYFTEFMLRNIEWLEEKLVFYDDNLYLVFELPRQTELYAHFPFMRDLVRKLESWGFRLRAIYKLDSHFTAESREVFRRRCDPKNLLNMCAQAYNCVLLKAEHEAWNFCGMRAVRGVY